MIKKTILMCMMVLMFQPAAFAQKRGGKGRAATQKTAAVKQTWDFSTIDNLLPLYVTAKKENKDFNSPLTGILVFYGGFSDAGKRECRKYLVDKMDEYYNEQKPAEALAIADIYGSIAPVNDFGRMRVYFYRGEQAATAEGDTVKLKQCINDILALPDAGNENKSQCLSALNGYLEEIRNYIPVDKTIDGVWVSNIGTIDTSIPFFILNINTDKGGTTYFTLAKESAYLTYAHSLDGQQIAQEEFVYNTDSIYATWSNEDMKNPSPELNYMFRQTAGTFASALSTKVHIEGGAVLGSITNSLVGLGTDLIAEAIFTPSKHAYVLQAKMRKLNDRQLEADIFSTKLKVKGDNKPKINEDKWHVLFTKIEPGDSLFWMYYPLLISFCGTSEEFPVEMQEKTKKNIRKRYGLNFWSTPLKTKAFNDIQYSKMYYKNEEKLIEQGETGFSNIVNIHNSCITPTTGVTFDGNSTTVSKVLKYSPADFAELKKADIITHVDGYEVNTTEQLKRIITRKKPFDTVTLTVKRKKKTMEIPLELYFKYEPITQFMPIQLNK